jgi:hypothetical protein
MSKPKPGVCGRCGCAVVRSLREPVDGEKNGHAYWDGQLVRTRCKDHGGRNFTARPDDDIIGDDFGWDEMPTI